MKLRNQRLISAAAWMGAWAIRGWIGSLRYRYLPQGPVYAPPDASRHGRVIYTFWHEVLLLPAYHYGARDLHVLISKHADGQLIAEIIRHLGFETVRGSSSRGGTEALREMLRITSKGHVAITPDGPRGPRRVVQPGVIYLASRTGLPIAPFGFASDNPWRAKSWDRFALPRPFKRAVGISGEGIYVPRDADHGTIEHYRLKLQNSMDELTAQAEEAIAGKMPLGVAA